ncbi:Major facilitator superfamily domain [Zalerion maritima]|uniref:Major facilitator superfamily domain n=1 Tax=Zalerion maritima TaxID=339359 RepID=A0AAD5WSI7_9PEZI|nr:Major facilitator superfamily domain [Zalerion maritima]
MSSHPELQSQPEREPKSAQPPPCEEAADNGGEVGRTYPGGLQLGIILVSLCLCLFLCGLDQTVITTAVPIITNEFHALDDVGWYTAAYLLTTSTFQIAYGKLYTTLSVKVIFLVAMAIFEIGSIICAAAPNSTALIVGRAVAGLGAAGMFPGGTLILVHSAPLERRPGLLGIMTGMFGVASLAGPFIGGVFADKATWRWCFIINVPLGVITAAVIVFFVKTPVDPAYAQWSFKRKVAYAKLPEILLLVAALICLVLALQWGGAIYPWSDGRVVALLVVFSVLTLAFIGLQTFLPSSRTVPTTIINNRDIWFGGLFAACSSGAMFVAVTYLPIYFQAVKGATALLSGLNVMPLILGFLVMSIAAGILTHITGYYNPSMFLCSIFSSVGAGLISTFAVDTPSHQWIGYQVLLGIGIGFGLQQPLIIAQTVLAPADVPFGVAMTNMLQMLGGAVFVAVSQNVFQNELAAGIPAAIPGFDTAKLLNGGVTDFDAIFTPDQIPIVLPIYSQVLDSVFQIAAGLCAATIIGALGSGWHSVKQGKTAEASSED